MYYFPASGVLPGPPQVQPSAFVASRHVSSSTAPSVRSPWTPSPRLTSSSRRFTLALVSPALASSPLPATLGQVGPLQQLQQLLPHRGLTARPEPSRTYRCTAELRTVVNRHQAVPPTPSRPSLGRHRSKRDRSSRSHQREVRLRSAGGKAVPASDSGHHPRLSVSPGHHGSIVDKLGPLPEPYRVATSCDSRSPHALPGCS